MMKRENLKKIAVILSIIAVTFLIVLGIVAIIKQKKVELKDYITDPAHLRALNYEHFEDGDDNIEGVDGLKFSAFFLFDSDLDGYAEKVKGTCNRIGTEDTLYMELIVQNDGIFKNGVIEIDGKNFYLKTSLPKDSEIKEHAISPNTHEIELNDLSNGTQKMFLGYVRSGIYTNNGNTSLAIGTNINNYSSKDNTVTLRGTYVKESGEEIPVEKEIKLETDWYGISSTKFDSLRHSQKYDDINSRINEDDQTITFDFTVATIEDANELILSKNVVEVDVPLINDEAPLSVFLDSNGQIVYNEETHKATIIREAAFDENGNAIKSISSTNSYKISLVYPLEAFKNLGKNSIDLKIPVREYYEGINNNNIEFSNPIKSNIASDTISAYYYQYVEPTLGPKVSIKTGYYYSGWYVSKQKPLRIYNRLSDYEPDDVYPVEWNIYTGTDYSDKKIVIKETPNGEARVSDEFEEADGSIQSMEQFVRYKKIRVSGVNDGLNDLGNILIYDDETNNLIKEINKQNYDTEEEIILDGLYVRHIRVEITGYNAGESIFVEGTKIIDDVKICELYSKEEFEGLKHIKSHVVGYRDNNMFNKEVGIADYQAPYSDATISLSKPTVSNQATEKNLIITINTPYNAAQNQVGWTNGSFLIKVPDEIAYIELNDSQISGMYNKIIMTQLIEDESGKYIKINTENANPASYSITVDCDIAPDPRCASGDYDFILYAANAEGTYYKNPVEDIYDCNDNLNTTEIISEGRAVLEIIAPNSLLTNQTISEFDDENTVVVSPQIADITPLYAAIDNEQSTAKIGIDVKNNYSQNISELLILGKIPFEGNTLVITGSDMGSSFSTKMNSTGIEIPEELEGKIKVYYSENESPTKNINDDVNNWREKENVNDFSKIKSFLIDFQQVEIIPGKKYTFNYVVTIPGNINFNSIAYSHHGAYFCLNTPQGKYRTQVQPNKIGLRIAQKYHLNITKYHKFRDKIVPEATYSVKEVSEDDEGNEILIDPRTTTIHHDGIGVMKKMYAEKVYEIQEFKTPVDYELNENKVRIIGHVDSQGHLSIEKLSGDTRGELSLTSSETEGFKVQMNVEDEARARLVIHKIDKETEQPLKGVIYRVKGKNLPEEGIILATDIYGKAYLKGLSVDSEYTIQEVRSDGYYLNSDVKFKIINNEGVYEVIIIDGQSKGVEVEEEDCLPIINLNLEDEKIPTFNLNVVKIQKDINLDTSNGLPNEGVNYLAGCKFRLYKDGKELGSYITDSEGKFRIENLYQQVDNKDFNATYVLKEVEVPEGFSKVKDITFQVKEIDGYLYIEEEISNGQSAKNYWSSGKDVNMIVEDSPSFKLIKRDDSGNLLSGIKFAIFNIDEDLVPAKNCKGEYVGEREIVNGKEYRVVTTDSNGEITIDLPEGLYMAQEVLAPEIYEIEDSIYYFGIGTNKEGSKGLQVTEIPKDFTYSTSVVDYTNDDGFIFVGDTYSTYHFEDGTTFYPYTTNQSEGLAAKYSFDGTIEWWFGLSDVFWDGLKDVKENEDGTYYIAGYTTMNKSYKNGVKIVSGPTSGWTDSCIIKLDEDGNPIWGKMFGGSNREFINEIETTIDGGVISESSNNSSSVIMENGDTYDQTKTIITKHSSDGELEWSKGLASSGVTIKATNDNGFLASIKVENELVLSDSISINIDGEGYALVKYDSNGNVDWYKTFENGTIIVDIATNNDRINFALVSGTNIETSRGTILSRGIIGYDNDGNELFAQNENATKIYAYETGYIVTSDKTVIKYDNTQNPVWRHTLSSTAGIVEELENGKVGVNKLIYKVVDKPTVKNRSLHSEEEEVKSISSFADGSFIKCQGNKVLKYDVYKNVEWEKNLPFEAKMYKEDKEQNVYIVGSFSGEIILENGFRAVSYEGSQDGIIVKMSSSGELLWAKELVSDGNDEISSIDFVEDGSCLISMTYEGANARFGTNQIYYEDDINTEKMLFSKLDSDGNLTWIKHFRAPRGGKVEGICSYKDGFIVVGKSYGAITLPNGNNINSLGGSSHAMGFAVYYKNDDIISWTKSFTANDNGDKEIKGVLKTSDENILIIGNVSGKLTVEDKVIDSSNISTTKSFACEYDQTGALNWINSISPDDDHMVVSNSVAEISRGIIVINGYTNSNNITGTDVELISNDKNWYEWKISKDMPVEEKQELEIINDRKTVGIYTDVNEISGKKGGSISGENKKPYEKVKYGDTSVKQIKIVPDENYEILNILVNGKEIEFTPEDDGSYIMPFFEDMIEDKTVVVTFTLQQNKYTIEKVDSISGEKLSGALFKLDQLEERTTPENVIREPVGAGPDYHEINWENEVTPPLESLTPIGDYYFVYENGQYIPTNSKSYRQKEDENATGVASSTAYSYIPIDLRNFPGYYRVVVNAEVSSEKNDYGFCSVSSSTSKLTRTAAFFELKNEVGPENYVSGYIEGGKRQYLHFAYVKNSSKDGGEDTFKINSIKIYGTNSVIYNFEGRDGKLVSTNNGASSTICASYIPIDLTNYSGMYNVEVNAEIHSELPNDIGYGVLTTYNGSVPTNTNSGKFFEIYGDMNDNKYSTTAVGGRVYYLYVVYSKNDNIDAYTDELIINDINVTLNDSELFHTQIETYNNGLGSAEIPFGKYQITEIRPPEGYALIDEPVIVEFRDVENKIDQITIPNVKLGKVKVHHFIKDTEIELAKEEVLEDKVGNKYFTQPIIDFDDYMIEEIDGNLVLPDNANGIYTYDDIDVNYYYVRRPIPLVVNHLIEGTNDRVPLRNGLPANPVTIILIVCLTVN